MFSRKTRDVITLFHKASSPSSAHVLNFLKEQAVKSASGKGVRPEFELDVTEAPPTSDQLRCILGYLKQSSAPSTVVPGSSTADEAMKKLNESPASFVRPVIVDWENGTATTAHTDSEILKMLSKKN